MPAVGAKDFKRNCISIDVEDWFNILDADAVPDISRWGSLESRLESSLEIILSLLDEANVKATFFWLGWFAERYPVLLGKCVLEGHEIASHGYGHVLANRVGRVTFSDDMKKSRQILEDLTGSEVLGFRAPGFGILGSTDWVFEEIINAGFTYDSSVFPASHGHGGLSKSDLAPHFVRTQAGPLFEIPQSVVGVAGKRLSLFGGGYLRLAPMPVIKWGVKKLHKENRPLIVYVHPREVDVNHPRLKLPLVRRFKSYVNLSSTFGKLQLICNSYSFQTMRELYENQLDDTNVSNKNT